jgi:hypothetical protein
MTYAINTAGSIGFPPIEAITAVPANLAALAAPPGAQVDAVDPVWGPGEFIYARAGAGIRQYGLVTLLPVWDSTNKVYTWNATEAPSTTILGRMIGVSMCVLTTGQYGWFCISGLVPCNSNASVAADTTFANAATGQGGALVAGKQIVNARVVRASTGTVAVAGTGANGDTKINLDARGFILAGALSGTGVGASALVSSIDPMGRYIIASVANSAAIAGTVTCTYNDGTVHFNIVHLNRSFSQGAIT